MNINHQDRNIFPLTLAQFETLLEQNHSLSEIKNLLLESYTTGTEIANQNRSLREITEPKNCPYQKFVGWLRNFIVRPHILLGRSGSVCPYVSYSLKKELFFCAVYSGEFCQNTVEQNLLGYRDWFLELEVPTKQDAVFKTLVLLLPDLSSSDTPQFMKTIHTNLKTEFINKGLMLGEFFPGYSQRSLWNSNFYPLSSPLPLFVIRYMVGNDYYFLKNDRLFFEAYLKFFRDKIPHNLEKLVKETAKDYQIKV